MSCTTAVIAQNLDGGMVVGVVDGKRLESADSAVGFSAFRNDLAQLFLVEQAPICCGGGAS